MSSSPPVLGIIAGGGSLPAHLARTCDKRGIEVFIIGFEGQTERSLVEGRNYVWTRIGKVGHVIDSLHAQKIRDIVMIGAIKRPTWSELKPDWKTATFLMKIGTKALGDDGLLAVLRKEMENEGFVVHGIHEFADDLLAPPGAVGAFTPQAEDEADIARGLNVARTLGALDVGQSVVMQGGMVLGVEGIEGTDALIERCGILKRSGRGPVLVKVCKPGQDKDLDLPTIGPKTVDMAARAGFAGIVFEAGRALLIDPQVAAEKADKAKMFMVGI